MDEQLERANAVRTQRVSSTKQLAKYHEQRHPFDTAVSLLRNEADEATNHQWAEDCRIAADFLEAAKGAPPAERSGVTEDVPSAAGQDAAANENRARRLAAVPPPARVVAYQPPSGDETWKLAQRATAHGKRGSATGDAEERALYAMGDR